jgi:hypothetical protein
MHAANDQEFHFKIFVLLIFGAVTTFFLVMAWLSNRREEERMKKLEEHIKEMRRLTGMDEDTH